MADHFLDDKAQELFREIRIQQGHVETLALAAQKFPEGGELAGVDDGGWRS